MVVGLTRDYERHKWAHLCLSEVTRMAAMAERELPLPSALEEWLKRHKRVSEMLTKDDWVSMWIGLATFAVVCPFSASGVSVYFFSPLSPSLGAVLCASWHAHPMALIACPSMPIRASLLSYSMRR